MTNISELALKPDQDTMQTALYALFRHSLQGMVELGWTDQSGDLKHAKQYDVGDLDDLVAFAMRVNERLNHNVYISAGLRRTDIDRDHRAADKDVIAIAALKVDCDSPGCMEAALAKCELAGLRPSLVHFSGKYPYLRGALWWVLDEPEPDLARVRAAETRFAHWLDTDRKVVNASRVMRLPGSVAWPIKAGRVKEMTGAFDAPTRPQPYTIDELESSLRRAGASDGNHAGADVIDFSRAAQALDIESLIQLSHEPAEWHGAMVKATAHLLGRKTPPDVIIDLLAPRVTWPSYSESQTRQELAVMIRGALDKGWGPATAQAVNAPAADPTPSSLRIWSMDELQSRDPPSWLIGGMIPENAFGCLYGESNTYKSFLALDMALAIAYGRPWHGRQTKQGAVLYVLGEGQTAFANRVRCWREAYGLQGVPAPFYAILEPVQFGSPVDIAKLIAAVQAADLKPDMSFIDTLARNFGPGDPDKTQDMQGFVAGTGAYQAQVGGALFVIHHAGKDPTKGARNSTVLKAAVDVEMRSEREEGNTRVRLVTTKQKDAEQAEPIWLQSAPVTAHDPRTGEEITSLVFTLEAPAAPAGEVKGNMEKRVVGFLMSVPEATAAEVIHALSSDRSNTNRALKSLVEKELVFVRNKAGGVTYFLNENIERSE